MFEWVDLYAAAFEGRPLKDQMKDWLYEDNWSKEKYDEYLLYSAVPIVSDYMGYLLDARRTEEYLNRYGMDYQDIHDPSKLPSSRSAIAVNRAAINFVSRNISRLYR